MAKNSGMGLIFIRTIVVFITLLLVMRMMGKRQIGEMQPFELVITLLIAELACIPMADTSVPLLYGIVSIVSIYFLHQLVCLIDLHVPPLKYLISGKPCVIMNKNGIDEYQLKKNSLDVSDLIEALRSAGYFSLASVEYALYESNGTFSALARAGYEEKQNSLPILIVDDGKINQKNVEFTGMPPSFFVDELKKHGIGDENDVLVFTVDGDGKCYLQEKGKKFTEFSIELPKEKKW